MQRDGSRPGSQQKRGHGQGGFRQLFGVARDRQRVQVHHAVEGVVPVLEVNPPAQCPEVVAQMGSARRLDPREHGFSGLCGTHDKAGYPARRRPGSVLTRLTRDASGTAVRLDGVRRLRRI